MEIIFSLSQSQVERQARLSRAEFLVPELYYEVYIANVSIVVAGATRQFPDVPLLYFLSALNKMLIESYLTGTVSVESLWDTGHRFSLSVNGAHTILEIPIGGEVLRVVTCEFVSALKACGLRLLWVMHEDKPELLASDDIFEAGSVFNQAAQLIRLGKVPRAQ